MPSDSPDFYNDLELSLVQAFGLLSDAVGNRQSPCHTPVISSILKNEDGDLTPSARVVVLRAFNSKTRTFRFHTDTRSDKIQHLADLPSVCAVFYDPTEKIQLRLTGISRVDSSGPLADKAWEETRPFSRECYRIEPGPGAQIEAGSAYIERPLLKEFDPGRQHFGTVEIRFDMLEWLYLSALGHRRARYVWDQQSMLTSDWLVP
ncbi:MAG: pyridoxamine 5'-phosphate oxidase family protein [Hyphomicrobiales bacterium]